MTYTTARFYLHTRLKPSAPLDALDRLTQRFEAFLDTIGTDLPIEITAWEGTMQTDGSRHWTFAVEMSGPQCIQTREEIEGRLDDFVASIAWMPVAVLKYGWREPQLILRREMDRVQEVKQQMRESEGVATPMPRYRCHKEVWALKIAEILDPTEDGNESDGSRIIVPADSGYAPFYVDWAYVRKHKPEVGGYFVVYADGYKSYSPAKAFEEGYTRI